MADMMLLDDKRSIIEQHEKSLFGKWLNSKTAKDHFLCFKENFSVSKVQAEGSGFLE